MIEVCHVWPFPLKSGVFMCCPASTAGQMELRKTRVTVLFVLAGCFVYHLCLLVCCFISVILVYKVTGSDRLALPHQRGLGKGADLPVFYVEVIEVIFKAYGCA